MEFFHLIRATQKSGQPDAVVWLSAKTESRANLQLDVILEDAGIETGRGKDYMKPVRTDFPVYDDLPEEGEIDLAWCEKYLLAEDQRTWQLKMESDEVADAAPSNEPSEQESTVVPENDNARHPVNLSFEKRVIGTWLFGHFDELTDDQMSSVSAAEMDTDATYAQNVILASRSVTQLRHVFHKVLVDLYDSAKSVWPADGKSPTLSDLVSFFNEWIDARGDKPSRQDITAKWQKKYGRTQLRTDTGTSAGGGIKTDRNTGYVHTLDTLDLEIALATLPMDFDIYNFPASILRRAKEIVSDKEKPFNQWSNVMRKTPGILDFSRAAIFAVIRTAPENVHVAPGDLQQYINSNLTEYLHEEPSAETLAAARHIDGTAVTGELEAAVPETPVVSNLGDGKFAIDGLVAPRDTTTQSEGIEHVQMEETQQSENKIDIEIPAGKSTDADDTKADTVDSVPAATVESVSESTKQQLSEPASVWPEYFEPGRYKGLPNDVYHAANGISSTQIKDARVSLSYFCARHVTKIISRESTDALTFGNLVHTLGLEPEKFDEEFAVFPGVPDGAFTNTDTLKAFIREYNTDKPKADQLKLTGKKEELQESIRAVKPDAVFADEFEKQWIEDNQDKTIISDKQLMQAKLIQQALLSHPTAGKLLTHPNRSVEVSYFGIDDETGLEVRVRPDLEIDMDGLRIGGDLKTISMWNVKQDFLRARLHREIIDRDYHLSAAMYCDVAGLDQFYWIFVNKDENYHWIAIVEATEELLELGRLEYRKVMRGIANGFDTGVWPAPITTDYADELNDFDLRRLETLRTQA